MIWDITAFAVICFTLWLFSPFFFAASAREEEKKTNVVFGDDDAM
tara:strand:- start:143 stop:277 length:135 start_codon:yes stop_codon:yes gene_type:complete